MLPLSLQSILRAGALSTGFAILLLTSAQGEEPGNPVPADRIRRIENLLGAVQAELDSLKHEARASAEGTGTAGDSRSKPILGELLSDRQRTLAQANRTDMRDFAVGYSFNADLPMGMHVLRWWDPWGVKLEGGAIVSDQTREMGLNLSGLYSINRFNALDLVETHLYAFTGAGYYWERVLWSTNISEPWYNTPDRWVRGQLGVGTEFSFFELGGVRFAPETGLQTDWYFSRHERSPNYNYGSYPKSDFSLAPFFSFHMSFYFR